MRKIQVPYIDQSIKYPTGCESVSAVMLLKYLGYEITVDEFIQNCLECREMEIRDGVLYGPDPNKFFCGNPYDEESYGIYARGLQKALAKAAGDHYEFPDETAGKAMILAKHMATRLRDGLHCDGFNIVQNNGEIAGQTVFHFHMHLIPRYEGDQVGLTWKPGELTDEMKEEILAKVKA